MKQKKFKKISIVTGIILSFCVLNFFTILNCTKAIELDSTKIVSKGDCGSLLTYQGIVVKTYYAEYNNQGENYPAYCLDKTKQGVTNDLSYQVSIQEAISEVGLWRYIIHGYPYQSIEQLGCANKEEAYTATKQAIYCYIHKNNPEDYRAIGEAGNRTLNALKKIVAQAQSSTETQISNHVTIKREQTQFKQDDIDKNYISKTYSVKAQTSISNYNISLEKGAKELPEGIKITDCQNQEKTEFGANEKFKILIPFQNIKEQGNFILKVKSKLQTKPVYYGKATQSNYQDYALTASTYENSIGEINEEYQKNETKIKIIKQDKENGKTLEGVTFNLYNDKKEILYSHLKTNAQGEILMADLVPGIYYLKEENSLDGYLPYEDWIEIKVNLNETITVTVKNTKEKPPEIKVEEQKISVQQEEKTKTEIRKLPVTGK